MNTKQLFDKFPKLETKRLFLKAIEPADVLSLLQINNDPDVVKNINYGKVFDLHDTYETIINYYPNLFNSKKAIVWGMYEKATNKLIGIRMCFVDSFEEPVTIQGQILPEYRHKGFTLEAYIEIIRLLRSVGVEEIKANCDKDNVAAIKLLKKLGFEEKFMGFAFSFFIPNPNAILFYKDLTIENTKLFNTKQVESPITFDEACALSMKMYNEREFAFAEEYINIAVAMEPNNPKVYLLKGKITRAVKGNLFAIHDYIQAIELDESLAEAYRELGICQYNVAMRSDAHKNWEKARQLGDLKAKELIQKYPECF